MQPLQWDFRPDGLRAPAVVAAFKGWNDAADAASSALTFIGQQFDARRFARLDPEEFFDFQQTRPQIRLTEGMAREIIWPEVEIYEARIPRAPRDLILIAGQEPALHWRTFSRSLLELCEALDAHMFVTLGALLADAVHTRPVPITGLASDPDLVERLGMQTTNYQGPTGIVGVLHAECAESGMPSASLWAAVPHYIAAMPNPKAALALVRKLETVIGVTVDAAELEESSVEYERQVTRAVEMDPDVKGFVERLEQATAQEEDLDPTRLPSGDALAREFQRFLRQRGPGDQPPG